MTIPYPHIPPEIIRIGPVAIRWYGMMYLLGYVLGARIVRGRIARGLTAMTERDLDQLVGYLVIGMLVGARTAYAIVYDPAHFRHDPLEFLRIWHGGLSFHGAVLGMILASLLFARLHGLDFWDVADTLAYAGTPGLFFGRLGNFINGELYGRPTSVPWAMVFPGDPLRTPRHPSQLYEAVAEGLILFLVLGMLDRWARTHGRYRPGLLAGAFLAGYGAVRILLEFTRQPDVQLGLVLGPFSMGQVLSAGMVVAGVGVIAWVFGRHGGDRDTAPVAKAAGDA